MSIHTQSVAHREKEVLYIGVGEERKEGNDTTDILNK